MNGRTVVSPVDLSVMTAMWVLLGGDGGEVTARSLLVSSAHRARREPWVCSRGYHWARSRRAVNGAEVTAPGERPACVRARAVGRSPRRDPVHQPSIPVADPGTTRARSRTRKRTVGAVKRRFHRSQEGANRVCGTRQGGSRPSRLRRQAMGLVALTVACLAL